MKARRAGRRRDAPSHGRASTAIVLLALAAGNCGAAGDGAPAQTQDETRVLLQNTWTAYTARFVQPDGRVVDPKAGGITTSEGQAYAMLRAVWIEDRGAFDRTFAWAVNNLNRGVRADALWAWRWGAAPDGSFRVLDQAFASDADEDAALALILAARTWNDEAYLRHARAALADLWEHGTIVAGGRRYLLGGDTLCQGSTCRINPSYYAPYAYRIFAREDPAHDWLSLVETTYFLLGRNSGFTTTRLPSDWILLDTATGELRPGSETDSRYSYDAFRVHWRVALDAALYGESRAHAYSRESLAWAADRFRQQQRLPAIISSRGEAKADYEAPEMLAAIMPALRDFAPDVADAISQRLQASLSDGLWGDRESYYLQNWAWFGTALDKRHLVPFERVR